MGRARVWGLQRLYLMQGFVQCFHTPNIVNSRGDTWNTVAVDEAVAVNNHKI